MPIGAMGSNLKNRLLLFIFLFSVLETRGQLENSISRCPDKCICFRTTVRCMFVQLNAIPRVPSATTVLDLRFNRIRTIPPGIFKNLSRLNTLLLNNNQISWLQEGAFEGLTRLRYLYLYKNRIRRIDSNAFTPLANLEQLYLHFNDIGSVDASTFTPMPSLQRLFLHNNRLRTIPVGAFRNLHSLKRLRLDSNALVCDCQLLWLAEMAYDHAQHTLVAATCGAPSDMHGKSIMSLRESQFFCRGMPTISEGPQDVQISFGSMVEFSCKAEGDPSPDVTWIHNNEVIQSNQPRYSVRTDGTLLISNAQNRDEGFYECRANNTLGQVTSRRALASMQAYTGPHTRPEIIEEPANTNLTTGLPLRLKCNITGYPPPTVSWNKERDHIFFGDRITVSPDHSLVFQSVSPEDSGIYSCTATNNLGQASAFAAIRVTTPVRIVTAPQEQIVAQGAAAQFNCSVVGHPRPTIQWQRDGSSISQNSKYSISIGGEALRVLRVTSADEGEYSCYAVNELMDDVASARLRLSHSNVACCAPKIMDKPRDQTVPNGQVELSLSCRAEGQPSPSVQWTKNGQLMDKYIDGHSRVASDGSLHLYNVSTTDEGLYECRALNDIGFATATATVTVNEAAEVISVAGVGDQFFRESFLEANRKVNRALNMTLDQLFNQHRSEGGPLPHELLRVFRFPHAEGREIARAAEKIEQTLHIVYRHVQNGMVFNNLTNFSYKDLLSPDNLEILTNVSGCLAHRRTVSCNDMCFHLKYRTIDGTCNNLDHPVWGSSLTGFKRLLPPIYENGFNSPVGCYTTTRYNTLDNFCFKKRHLDLKAGTRETITFGWSKTKVYHGYFKPSPRLVSTRIMSTEESSADTECTHMLMQWGQFVDHDMDHALPSISTESFSDGSQCQRSCEYSAPCFPIEIPYDDPRVYRHRCMEFTRSSAVCGSGMTSVFFDTLLPREQINQLTSFIDASQVYGSSYGDTQSLRNFTNNFGQLKIGITMPSGKPMMPFSDGAPIDCRRDTTESGIDCFLAGDVRANEQTGLLAMHTVWFREHNRMAEELREINPHWDGDTVFHETRKILGALMQHITYSHWLPHIIGPSGMTKLGDYKGYDSTLNPSVSNAFATAAFRFGHSLVSPILHRLNSTFQPIRHGPLPLHKAFFSPWRLVQEGGIDPLLRGLFATAAKLKKPGQFLNTELTEKLFRSAHEIALDLAAMNIQRGRDHALPGYLEWREYCHLSAPDTFDELSGDISSGEVRDQLQEMYGHPGNVDLWVGALLEDSLPGARVGPTVQCLLVDQFRRLRDGDRFWFENPSVFKPEQLVQIKRISLGKILCNSGDDISDVTKNVFVLPHLQAPAFVPCDTLPNINLRFWADCCKDCRNAGYFNSLIRTPGLRLRRSVDDNFSYVEDRDHQQYFNLSTSPHQPHEPHKPHEPQEEDIEDVAVENFKVAVQSKPQYGFMSVQPQTQKSEVNSGLVTSEHVSETLIETPVSTSNRGQNGGQMPSLRAPIPDVNTPPEKKEPLSSSEGSAEERIEGLETALEKLVNVVQHLTRKVEYLEGTISSSMEFGFSNWRNRDRRGNRAANSDRPGASFRPSHSCKDSSGTERQFKDVWWQDKCTRCTCRRKGVRCRVPCPRLTCDFPTISDEHCCPICLQANNSTTNDKTVLEFDSN